MKYVDRGGKEKALVIILERFKNYGSYFEFLRKYSPESLLWVKPDDNIMMNIDFGMFTLFWDANLKMDAKLISLAHGQKVSCNWPYGVNWECGWQLTIKGKEVFLADIGNLLFGYNAARAGFSYEYLEQKAFQATLEKTNWNYNKAIENEIPDRKLYKAWYDLASKTTNDSINIENIIQYLFQWL